LNLGDILSLVGPDAFGQSGEAEGFDSGVSLAVAIMVKIVDTGDSWEPDALTGHVRFREGAECQLS
jgi:hypothetical protein